MDSAVFRPSSAPASIMACSNCNLQELCLPQGLTPVELAYVDRLMVTARRKVDRGAALFRDGDRFDFLYAIRTGFFKTTLSSADGREQVTGFQMGGELLGLDGIHAGQHGVDAVALEDSHVCAIRFDDLQAMSRHVPSLQHQLHRLMSSEVMRTQAMMLLLGSMSAEERVAAFLQNLTLRMKARGFSASSLLLRMTREDIGSYLGLSVETVSRTLSKLQAEGLLFVRHRNISITDPVGLQQLLDGAHFGRAPLSPIANDRVSAVATAPPRTAAPSMDTSS